MKPEVINGVKYQPIEWDDDASCDKCAFGSEEVCLVYSCLQARRRDNTDVYYFEIKDQ